jgi:N-acetylglutamate synthase
MNDPDIIRCEELFMNAWPSLTTILYNGCVIRLADGYTKRANSINPLYADLSAPGSLIEYGEYCFAQKKLPAVFKILAEKRYQTLDTMLEDRGYTTVDTTFVMKADLNQFEPQPHPDIVTAAQFDDAWSTTAAALHGDDTPTACMKQMLSLIVPEKIVATALCDGQAAGCGYGVREGSDVALSGIIVAGRYRRRGLGRQIMLSLLDHAAKQGATTAWLQVVAQNTGAQRLYEKLGFTREYNYWYRRQCN